MAASTMAAGTSGIESWVTSIRTTMASDPARQTLEDEIQTNGFLFLEEYLDSIMAGVKHDPIIELVKTPGRKKDVPKKTRAATAAASKAKSIVSMSLEGNDFDKENSQLQLGSRGPLNSFHKTLLQAKTVNFHPPESLVSEPASPLQGKGQNLKRPPSKAKAVVVAEVEEELHEEEDEEQAVEALVTPPHAKAAPLPERIEDPLPAPALTEEVQSLASDVINELSVIVEDDESAERSRRWSDKALEANASQKSLETAEEHLAQEDDLRPDVVMHDTEAARATVIASMDVDDFTQTTTFTASSTTSTQTFHTFPLELPVLETAAEFDSRVDTTATPHNDDADRTAPVTADPASAKGLDRKPSIPHFPTIGAPSPLRKSMRVPREPSLAAPPIAGPSTTRSSWLVKAREAKAIEENAKRSSALTSMPLGQFIPASTKRKSEEMHGFAVDVAPDGVERAQKLLRTAEPQTTHAARRAQDSAPFVPVRNSAKDSRAAAVPDTVEEELIDDESDGVFNRLKKTVEGYTSRAGKSMGKSLGGAAAAALAEARAAAEAKVAERMVADGRAPSPPPIGKAFSGEKPNVVGPVFVPPALPAQPAGREAEAEALKDRDRRFSVSDLVTSFEAKRKSKEPERVFQAPPPSVPSRAFHAPVTDDHPANISSSTTPPQSPPRARTPIFTVPEKPKILPSSAFFAPVADHSMPFLPQSLEPRVFSNLLHPMPLSAQPTFASTTSSAFSDALFDNEIPAWMPSTQDTEFSDPGPSQHTHLKSIYNQNDTQPMTDMDADESWHLDDKFAETWTPVVGMSAKDDSMTWSTAPTRSTRGDTGLLDGSLSRQMLTQDDGPAQSAPLEGAASLEVGNGEFDLDMDIVGPDDNFDEEDVRLNPLASQSTLSLASSDSKNTKPALQSSGTSFLSTASKLVSSVLGGSKKGKAEPVKSIQLAAVAAKRQQEEADKKATRLKEMEARRQQALQKKLDDDKAREERKIREEIERRKRDKEDNTDKRPLKQPAKKLTQAEEDLTKKRKAEADRKTAAEVKKPPSKERKDAPPSKIAKPTLNSSQVALGNSTGLPKSLKHTASTATLNASASVKLVGTAEIKQVTLASSSTLPPKVKSAPKDNNLSGKVPSQVVQAQMQARYQAQLNEEIHSGPTENIELPDINSEYSDSDDEDRVRTFDPPEWAQSPELRAELERQSRVNPDDIFGAIKPLKMEELFKTRTNRFRARTSSANWSGADRLTIAEETEYARRMGFAS